MPTAPKPILPAKVYLMRGDLKRAFGGWRQVANLIRAGRIREVLLPGYKRAHFIRAEVQAVLDEMHGQ